MLGILAKARMFGLMKITTPLVILFSALLLGCEKKPAAPAPAAPAPAADSAPTTPPAPAAKPNASAPGNNPLTAPTDYLGALAKGKKSSEKTIELVSLKQAVQLFYAQEGRYPKDLQELVTEKYLGSIPPPPAGMKMSYDAKTGDVKIENQ